MDFGNLSRSPISQFDMSGPDCHGTYWHTAGQIVDDFLTIYVPVFKMYVLTVSGVGRILVWGAVSRRRRGEAPKALRGPVPPPQKIFDYLILKWRILMHISGILTYLF